ncbi:ABC transporter substrate-binding protein [Cellulophaga omnivescoria]|uniref:ABC transporter substrate-binding protein n=1 Tax=Cellulophaga omnivescoria TaxID=1888890 RepID=UPI0022F047C8|nr:helical backbone metal receptor [Cellulophaga omnivescoria]WBU89624.1 helical backbone metal receptor [Cellulophaga omnivescoria]
MQQIIDQMGRQIKCPKKPLRIISLVPSQTELLVDLGLEEYIVGVTKFCVHPKHLRISKKVFGGTKKISLAKIEAAKPDIILCNKEENTKEIVDTLEKLYPVHVSNINDLEDSLELIMQYGSIFNKMFSATKIVNTIRNEANAFKDFIKNKANKKVVYLIWKDPYMTVGRDTFINHMLTLNNYTNVFADYLRYPETTLKAIQKLKPDCILLSSEPYPFKRTHIDEIKKIMPSTTVELVDGEYFSWYGSRLLDAFIYFKSLHY